MLQVTWPYGLSIQTRYLGATNFRGERIKAFTLDDNTKYGKPDSLTVPYSYEFSGSKAHEPAMLELHNKLNHNPEVTEWQDKECNHVAVSTGTNKGYIYIFTNKKNNTHIKD